MKTKLFKGTRNSWTMVKRSIKHDLRSVDALAMSIILPVMLLVLFTTIFGGAINTGTEYINYVVPGVFMVCLSFGTAGTAVSVCDDNMKGIIDRFRSMPINSSSVLTGHVVASMIRNTFAMIVVSLLAIALGFRPTADFADWLGVFGILWLLMLALTWAAAAFGLFVKNIEAAGSFMFTTMLFPYLSSSFVLISTLPDWLEGFAREQPINHAVEAIRALLLNGAVGDHAWITAIWCLGITAVMYAIARMLFQRQTA
jgi:ABC-2 type transport system permease protein